MNVSRNNLMLAGAAIALVAGIFLYRKFGALLSTKGTAYEGTGAVGVAGNLVNQTLGGAPAAIGSKIGEAIFSVFGPKDRSPDIFYSVTFPDGARHAVPSTDVDNSGYFKYAGRRYRLGTDPTTNKRVAIAA